MSTVTASEVKATITRLLQRDDPSPSDRITPSDVFDALAAPLQLATFQPPQGLPSHGGEREVTGMEIAANLDRLRPLPRPRMSVKRWMETYVRAPGNGVQMLRVGPSSCWLPGMRSIVAVQSNSIRFRFPDGEDSRLDLPGTTVLSADEHGIVWCEPHMSTDRYTCAAVLAWL